jgi:hypothetical protein
VKTFVQNALDRAFYRDRYDYRRALGAFARDLNSDLDLNRLSDRLIGRIVETLLIDRMALMLDDEAAPHFAAFRSRDSWVATRRLCQAFAAGRAA